MGVVVVQGALQRGDALQRLQPFGAGINLVDLPLQRSVGTCAGDVRKRTAASSFNPDPCRPLNTCSWFSSKAPLG